MTKQLEIICKNEGGLRRRGHAPDWSLRKPTALCAMHRVSSTASPAFSEKKDHREGCDRKFKYPRLRILFPDHRRFFEEDATTCLLLFNEVVNWGFDDDIFHQRTAEHFRNLLVCKDENTPRAADTAENVIVRYKNQSQIISSSFLISD